MDNTVLAKHKFKHSGDNPAHIRGNKKWLTPLQKNAQLNLEINVY